MKYNTLHEELYATRKENANLKKMFDEVHDNELETREKKKEILKWAYSLDKQKTQLKEEIIELKTKLYDATVKEQRLLKILNETSDYT